jgi:hypothetical protein
MYIVTREISTGIDLPPSSGSSASLVSLEPSLRWLDIIERGCGYIDNKFIVYQSLEHPLLFKKEIEVVEPQYIVYTTTDPQSEHRAPMVIFDDMSFERNVVIVCGVEQYKEIIPVILDDADERRYVFRLDRMLE